MAKEDGTWIMRGLDWDDPARIQSWQELTGWGRRGGIPPALQERGGRLLRGGEYLRPLLVE